MLNLDFAKLRYMLEAETSNQFGSNNSHARALQAVVQQAHFTPELQQGQLVKHNDKLVLPSTKHRYQDYPAYIDPKICDYNANFVLPHFIAGEGPYSTIGYTNENAFFNMLLNPALNITTVVAIGPAVDRLNNRQAFTSYFTARHSEHNLWPYILEGRTVVDGDQFSVYSITISENSSQNPPKTINLYHLKNVADFSCIPLDRDICILLAYLYHLQKEQTLFTHCSAGLGRTGIVALLFKLLDAVKDLEDPTEETISEIVCECWYQLNEIRPGMVQNFEQMMNAIQLMINIIPLLANTSELYADLETRVINEAMDELRIRSSLFRPAARSSSSKKRTVVAAGLDSGSDLNIQRESRPGQ